MDKTHNNTKFVCDKGGLHYVLGTMKNIDIKSLIIGALFTSTVIFGVAATSKDDAGKWDKEQQWEITTTLTDRLSGDWQNGKLTEETKDYLANMSDRAKAARIVKDLYLTKRRWEEATAGAEPFARTVSSGSSTYWHWRKRVK
jgi:Spy/CpxP family protein refolding chaperone